MRATPYQVSLFDAAWENLRQGAPEDLVQTAQTADSDDKPRLERLTQGSNKSMLDAMQRAIKMLADEKIVL